MDIARTVLISVLKASPPKTVIDVFRHLKATLSAVKITTIDPRALLVSIEPDLPMPIRGHVISMLIHDNFFDHLWDEFIETTEPDGRCHCFSM
jgi:hypothetical protein